MLASSYKEHKQKKDVESPDVIEGATIMTALSDRIDDAKLALLYVAIVNAIH